MRGPPRKTPRLGGARGSRDDHDNAIDSDTTTSAPRSRKQHDWLPRRRRRSASDIAIVTDEPSVPWWVK
jgi:hypothetical protein